MLAILLITLLTGLVLLVLSLQKRFHRLQGLGRGLLITYLTLIVLLGGAEAYFRCCYAESDGLPTLASQNWLARYWHTNAAGYRDLDWTPADLTGRTTVLSIGDSFTAGWGIADPADRFSNVLAQKLGDNFAVLNLGKPGASLIESTLSLADAPVAAPDLVVLQYYLNDIETAALSIGLDPNLDPSKGIPAWVNESHFANFVYWRLVSRFQPEREGTQTYWGWLYSMYDNAAVWEIHRQQIDTFIAAVRAKNAQLIVVIFPNMLDPFTSVPYVDRVAQAFEAQGYDQNHILKLFDAAAAMPLEQRIVSYRDAHASVAFNHLVGELLYEKIINLP